MKNIFLALLISLICSCGPDKNVPDNLLPQEKMVSILIDMHLLESQIQSLRIKKDSSQVLFNTFEREIYAMHEVEQSTYKESFEYYLEDANAMTEIYDAVVDSLNLREKSIQTDLEKDRTPNYSKFGKKK